MLSLRWNLGLVVSAVFLHLAALFLWGAVQAFTVRHHVEILHQRRHEWNNPLVVGAAAATTAEKQIIEDVLRRVKDEHTAEVEAGFEAFGKSSGPPTAVSSKVVWSDDDFVSRSVGVGNAGPDEQVLFRGDQVFQTKAPVFSKDECEELIAEAKQVIAAGLKNNNEKAKNEGRQQPTNSELGEARVSTMPRGREWLKTAMHEKLYPLLESRFGGQPDTAGVIRAEELTLHDALVIGYGYFGDGGGTFRSQPIHRDTSILSLNVALSPSTDYVGGGTYFEGLDGGPVQNEQGHVLCHAGGTMHAGHSIESGERWVLVLFVLAKNAPQLARRCHNRGVLAKRDGNLDEAENSFSAGLSVAPDDHLLHRDFGGVHMARDDKVTARASLVKTSEVYPLCQKALIGLGRMLLADGRPRAGLRRFDSALERLDGRDLMAGAWMPLRADGYNARVNAAHCAVMCADHEAAADKSGGNRKFAQTRLPEAIDRINVCIAAAPGDGHLRGMKARAEELLEEAEQGALL